MVVGYQGNRTATFLWGGVQENGAGLSARYGRGGDHRIHGVKFMHRKRAGFESAPRIGDMHTGCGILRQPFGVQPGGNHIARFLSQTLGNNLGDIRFGRVEHVRLIVDQAIHQHLNNLLAVQLAHTAVVTHGGWCLGGIRQGLTNTREDIFLRRGHYAFSLPSRAA